MKPTLIALHGYTMNGARLRELGQALFDELAEHVNLVFPDAPNVCTPASAQEAFTAWGIEPPEPPHLRWWRANEDGSVYEGWPTTREFLHALIADHAPVGLLGFSQGASVAGTVAALSARGTFPHLACVVLIAGGVPRATDLAPLFSDPITVPSLHVWGERDRIAAPTAPRLAACFDESQREIVTWPGFHSIPQHNAAGTAISRFIRERLGVAASNTHGSSTGDT